MRCKCRPALVFTCNVFIICYRMPLYHFVTADLPFNTKAPELDDTNAVTALRSDAQRSGHEDFSAGLGITQQLMGVYLAYLVAIGFLPAPPKGTKTGSKSLPKLEIGTQQRDALGKVGGRGALV